MSIYDIIRGNTFLIGILIVGSFFVWKFIIEPIMNEGQPIEPSEEDIKTFEEKMMENIGLENQDL